MASLLNRPSNFIRRRSTILQAEKDDENSYDFDLYDDDSYDYDDDDDEREILLANETFNQLNLHVLLYVAAWYTGKKLQHTVSVPVPMKYENNMDTETTTKGSQRFRSTANFTITNSVQLTLSEITVESLNNALKNDVTKAKELMLLNHRKKMLGSRQAGGEERFDREVTIPLYFIIRHRSKILSNPLVSLTEDELREFCVKLIWAHPPSLYTRGTFCTSQEFGDDSLLYSTSILSRLCSLAKKYAGDDEFRKNVRVLYQHRASQREPPTYAMSYPLTCWLEDVYGKNLVKEFYFGDDNSLNETDLLSKQVSIDTSDRNVDIADKLFEIPRKGDRQNNDNYDDMKSCNIELIAPAQTLFIDHDVVFVLELLSDTLTKSVSYDYYNVYLRRKYDTNAMVRTQKDIDNQLTILQNDIDEGIDIMISVIAAIPGFIKTSLFLRKDDRERIFSCTSMRHILLDDEGTRCWLVPLLRLDPSRAMFYMNHISSYLHPGVNGIIDKDQLLLSDAKEKLGIDDDETLNRLEFIAYIQEKRDNFFERFYVNGIDRYVFYAITEMERKMQEKLAGIQSVEWLVDNVFRSSRFPFVLLIMDGIMNVFVQASFQITLLNALLYVDIEYYAFASIIAVFSIVYFLIREILQTCSVRTFNEFKTAFTSIWNIVDWITIFLVITALILINWNIFGRRGDDYTNYLFSNPKPIPTDFLNMSEAILHNIDPDNFDSAREQFNIAPKFIYTFGALAILLQSLHFIFYLRLLNEDLGVLIFSITELTKNVKWFMFVLVIIIYAFAQIFLVLFPVQRSLIPCVFRDDLENNNQFNILLETIDVDLLSKFRPSELQEVLQDNLEVCDEGINFKYAYELMYGRFSCNMTIRLAWGPLLIICHVI